MGQRLSQPHLVLLADRRGWAFDASARPLAARLSDRFRVTIAYVAEHPDLDALGPDLLHVFYWGEAYPRRFRLSGVPIVREVASHRWQDPDEGKVLSPGAFAREHLADAAAVIAVSRRLERLLRDVAHPFHCANGVDLRRFAPPRRRRGRLAVGFAGRADARQKGLDEILRPAARGRVRMRIAGGDVDAGAMARFYRGIDVVAVASQAEGEPLTLLEGMACGCFPVATDVGVVPELVVPGMNGLVVERSPEAFADAFAWCAQNLDRVRRVGADNAELIRDTRSWDLAAPRWAAVFDYVLSRGPEPERSLEVARPRPRSRPAAPAAEAIDYAGHLSRMNPGRTAESTYLASRRYSRRELVPLLPADRDGPVVEIGSGFGHLLRFLLERGYRDVTGVDRSAELLAAVATSLPAGLVDLVHADGADYLAAQAQRTLSAVILFDFIEHVETAQLAPLLESARLALRPGGRVILRTPNMASLLGQYSRYMDRTHLQGFTEHSLVQLLEQVGFGAASVAVPVLTLSRSDWPDHVNRWLHRRLYRLQDRVMPKSFDKNVLVWAESR